MSYGRLFYGYGSVSTLFKSCYDSINKVDIVLYYNKHYINIAMTVGYRILLFDSIKLTPLQKRILIQSGFAKLENRPIGKLKENIIESEIVGINGDTQRSGWGNSGTNNKCIERFCLNCDKKIGKNRRFCSQECKDKFLFKFKRYSKIKRKYSRKCQRCGLKIDNNNIKKHHIIPRKYGGQKWLWNKILLCASCHNYVEIKTQEWIDGGGKLDVNILRFKIKNDCF